MKRALYLLANLLGGAALVLLLDLARPLAPGFILLTVAVVCAILPSNTHPDLQGGQTLPVWAPRATITAAGRLSHQRSGSPG
jgi:hypothetical protein